MASMNEELLSASVRHQVQVLRFTKNEVARAIKLLEKSDQEILARIKAGVTDWDEARLRQQLREIRRLREQVALDLKKQVEDQAQEFAENEAEWELETLNATSPVAVAFAGVAPQVLKVVAGSPINGVPLSGWLGQMVTSDVTRLEQALRLGILQGETKDQLVKRVTAVVEVTRSNASTIVRTAYNHVSNASKQEVWNQNADVLEGLRWSAMLDGRTSPVCRSRDGEVYPVDKGPRPPAHPNCRSQMVPVVKGEKIVGDKPFVRDARTRKEREKDFRAEARDAAGDTWSGMSVAQRNAAVAARRKAWIDENVGQVPSTTTYDSWLRAQPKAFQVEVLGPARAKMFRDGMPLDKFVDESGKQYSLAQLKAATKGDALNVMQPGVGLKAKALLQQGLYNDEVLYALQKEFPNASPSAGSIASYKSELKKAGLLDDVTPQPHYSTNLANTISKLEGVVTALESSVPAGVKHAVGGQWVTLTEELIGAPGVYAYYQSGKGVVASTKTLGGIAVAQAQQVLAHELGHMLHKQHQVDLPGDVIASLKDAAKALSPEAKKLYSYYLTHLDELTAEVYAQALSPSPMTSQGLMATDFNKVFAPHIAAAKEALAKKFPVPPANAPSLQPGAPTAAFEVAGKHTSIGSLAKALLQQGMPDEQVLAAVKAEFPKAQTGMNSIKSYKSELNKQKKIALGSGPTVAAKNPLPSAMSPAPPPPLTAVAAAKETVDELTQIMQATPSLNAVSASVAKETGIKLMKAGLLNNNEILSALSKLHPHNKVTPASVATWKSVWKKDHPDLYAKASSKHVKLDMAAEQAGPTQLPFLHGKPLGTKSTQVLNDVKANLAAGATVESQTAFIQAAFGGADLAKAQGVANLLELAVYEFNTAKAAAKAYLDAATKAAKAAPKKAAKLAKYQGVPIPDGWAVATPNQLQAVVDKALAGSHMPTAVGKYVVQLLDAQKLLISPKDMATHLTATKVNYKFVTYIQYYLKGHWKELKNNAAMGAEGVDLTPNRLAATPREGLPPPPRFTRQQHALALKQYGEPASPEWAKKVNDRYGLTGENAVTPEEIGFIRSYTGNKTYELVNRLLREGQYASVPALQAYVDAAQHGLRKMPPYVGPVTRGVRWLPHGTTINDFLARYPVGGVVEEHSFLSTAQGTSAVYHGPVYFKINSKTGRDVDWLSKFSGNEREVIMMPGTRLLVTKIEKDKAGKYIIHCDEVE